ncbi:OX-2 membrane glycoprotein-like [Mixophyes fleayi]|uniref:OX-2 membrane glycoprotein-like n=1 Tax=Mixophyes fleayi TaxID=3061075 RepID=UPI003F4E3B69
MSWKEAYFHIVCMLCSARAVMGFDDTVNTISAQVDFGESAKLECNLLGPNNLNQVTWTKIVGNKETTVATYTKSEAKISKEYEKRLNISISNLNKTTITVFKASVDDEGCYTCVFNVFPTGSQRGKVCLSISGDVLIEKQHKARLGEAVTLRCLLRTQSNVRQVSWQKNGKNIATYNTVQGTFSVSEHENILKMTMLGLNNTAVTIGESRVSDEGDYHCLFNSFPSGSSEGKTTLHVYEPLNVTLFMDKSKDFLNITCVARGASSPSDFMVRRRTGLLHGQQF